MIIQLEVGTEYRLVKLVKYCKMYVIHLHRNILKCVGLQHELVIRYLSILNLHPKKIAACQNYFFAFISNRQIDNN